MLTKFNLLLQNKQELQNYSRLALQSNLIENVLGHKLLLPPENLTSPFIFSCFALSQDGKLCYPDTLSGLDIAKANKQATTTEKTADLVWLMLARSISDAVIFGSNIFKKNSSRKKPTIMFEELIQERINNKKLTQITPIIFCRNLDEIDFSHEMLAATKQPFIIFHKDKKFATSHLKKTWNQQKLSEFNSISAKIKNLILIDTDLATLFYKLKHIGYKVILNESPYFHHKLLVAKLLNEVWLNYSGVYVGGSALSLGNHQISFTTNSHPESTILYLYNIDYHFLYSRQLISYTP